MSNSSKGCDDWLHVSWMKLSFDTVQLASGWELSNDQNWRKQRRKKIEALTQSAITCLIFVLLVILVHQTEGLIMVICKAFYNHFENQWADEATAEHSILCETTKTCTF